MKFKYIIFFLIAGLAIDGLGQESGVYPDLYSSHVMFGELVNPAYCNRDMNAFVLRKSRTGIYNDISNLSAVFTANFEARNRMQFVRLYLSNEQEGPYIATPRAYLNYGVSIPLTNELNLAGGLKIGAVNPSYNTPTKSQSAIILDGEAGALLTYKEELSVGIAVHQLFNNVPNLIPGIQLKRYYSIMLAYDAKLNNRWSWSNSIWALYYADLPFKYFVKTGAKYELYEFGGGFESLRGVFVYGSVDVKIKGNSVKFGALYNSAFFDQAQSLGTSFELSLGYVFSKL